MAKKYDISMTRIYKRVMEMEERGAWPFKSVTAEQFLDAVRPLIKNMDDIFNGEIDGKKLPAAVFQDQNIGAAIKMLKCLQKMEYEEKDVEMALLVGWAKENLPKNLTPEEMEKFLAEWSEYMMPDELMHKEMLDFIIFAKEEMYRYNNQANTYMHEVMVEDGLTPRYIGEENERDYIPSTMKEFTLSTTRDHEEAVRIALEEIDNLLKYGLPSETKAMQLKDKMIGADEYKGKNQTIVDRILSAEADLEIVNLYIIPELTIRIKELEGKAQVEKDLNEHGLGDAGDFYQKELARYIEAKDVIEKALLEMKQREALMQLNKTITFHGIEKGKCEVVVRKIKGGRQEIHEDKKTTPKGVEKKGVKTLERRHRESSITLEMGSASRRMYAEKRKAAAVMLGYTYEGESVGEKRGIRTKFEAKLGEAEFSRERTSKLVGTGRRSFRVAAKANVARLQDRTVLLRRDNEGKVKEGKTLFDGKVVAGAASASIENTKVIPVASASVKAAEASVEVLGTVKASASFGTLGYSTDPSVDKDSLKGKGIEQVFDTVVGGSRPEIGKMVTDHAKGAVDNFVTISKGLGKAGISIGGVSVLGATLKDGKIEKTEDKISEVKDFVDRVKEGGIGEVLKGISPIEQDGIDGQPGPVIETQESIGETEIHLDELTADQTFEEECDLDLEVTDEELDDIELTNDRTQ